MESAERRNVHLSACQPEQRACLYFHWGSTRKTPWWAKLEEVPVQALLFCHELHDLSMGHHPVLQFSCLQTEATRWSLSFSFFFFFKKKGCLIYFLREGKGGREGRIEWERNIDQLLLTHPQLGTWPASQACTLTGNQTYNLPVRRPALNPLSHTSQGSQFFLILRCQLHGWTIQTLLSGKSQMEKATDCTIPFI